MSHGHDSEQVGHIVPLWLLFGVFFALIILTALTVWTATHLHLGAFNIWLALIIASMKATLVALFFMHLIWDKPYNGIVLVGAFMFVILFLGISLMDTAENMPDMYEGPAPAVATE